MAIKRIWIARWLDARRVAPVFIPTVPDFLWLRKCAVSVSIELRRRPLHAAAQAEHVGSVCAGDAATPRTPVRVVEMGLAPISCRVVVPEQGLVERLVIVRSTLGRVAMN
ncbi:hypothetical protein OsJ_04154 [Oryza sativa Japonica Group]|uniref:Uncharacterized protein n=1 Tax=Oryza sativa subsp. japonica TaxID=39947 RepID=A2ZZT4_ORYSJ|nr:hypothetical protein OsJ_04154 [Oryza sativa Japonica Group]